MPKTEEDLHYLKHRRLVRIRLAVVTPTVLALVIWVSVSWLMPIPAPTFGASVSATIQLPGALPPLPWPSGGEAALSVAGSGSLGSSGSQRPVPIAGLAKVMTAYVVLHDHPIAGLVTGPQIPVTASTVNAAQAERASGEAVVPVTAGESLTESQALQALLVAQGNDIATLLADWDAGSQSAFVAKMNAAARSLRLRSTSFTDPTGLDPGTTSTPSDLIRLGEAAMAMPTFAQIVAMPQVTLPLGGIVYNLDSDLRRGGIDGMEFGFDSASGGCFLFSASETVGGRRLTLVGAVLGQAGASPQTTAMYGALALVNAAFSEVHTYDSLPLPHGVLGRLSTPWGASVPVEVTSTHVIGWPGQTIELRSRLLRTLPTMLPAGSRIGVLEVGLGFPASDFAMRTTEPVGAPPMLWRLTRL